MVHAFAVRLWPLAEGGGVKFSLLFVRFVGLISRVRLILLSSSEKRDIYLLALKESLEISRRGFPGGMKFIFS